MAGVEADGEVAGAEQAVSHVIAINTKTIQIDAKQFKDLNFFIILLHKFTFILLFSFALRFHAVMRAFSSFSLRDH